MFSVGQMIEDQYLVIERCRGRRWTLYNVLDRVSENVFVIKRPSENLYPGLFDTARFREKAKKWINVGDCDEIAKAYLVKDFEGVPHLFVEYIEGPSLADVLNLRPGKPLPKSQIIGLMKELASGMKFLHSASFPNDTSGMIHGGLIPHNILTIEGNIKITDIGLTSSIQQSADTRPSLLFDRIPYMAPEQVENPQRADRLTDIYSFGAVMYEVATGAPPAVNTQPGDPLAGAVRLEPAPPSLRNRSCPQWLDEVILKCMARKPENRFQTFDQISELINDLAAAEGIHEVAEEEEGESEPHSRVARVRGIAKKESRRLDQYYIGVEHLMLGLIKEEESVVVSCFGDTVTADQVLEKIFSRLPKGEGQWYWDGIRKTPRYERVMKLARKIRRTYSPPGERMLPQHLLLAILEEGRSIPARALRELGVDVKKAAEKLKRELMRRRPAIVIPEPDIPGARSATKVPCTTDVPYYIPFVGRRSELERIRELLLSDRRSVMIVGETGVGKTALIRELACLISDAATAFGPVSVFTLRVPALLASVTEAEEGPARFEKILSGAMNANAVLLVEDLPVLLGVDIKMPAGAVAGILDDYISSKGLLMIATATPSQYASCESSHGSLMARLEIVNLREPSFDEALEMLAGAKGRFEVEHLVSIADEALEAVIRISETLVSDMALPSRAFDLLDRICASCVRPKPPGGALEEITISAEYVERTLRAGSDVPYDNQDEALTA